ncbi:MAG: hypothetical protein A2931_03600 [Candidatus Niyogibacteria bacterium RIFCSPLOWO2_01_FULL_45_48]|uniref:Uncharacterized protein n=2 Tax=Candidatus Niyogiibacteriota TaxID=1817912 RepID=A0A1G2EWS1_9BACT|nr:MAG: hypothetical protein A2835_01430 [Candidatus Niyogibacteria bacterium RIFCSPHIGHO2_01_FULL_45_28]OGZ30167.1 MAG: hypothetical protein A3J00_00675 [Candidatus Niyogibacteria bacterium RIFCSPLOWO2_02_FULL_45_13]OGZ30913.1 MAG: hypothetical protein A2931_03600 [Candidatus Niyogibacteria bacterium RIFCSPLOWO2_01_FULL_45_48]
MQKFELKFNTTFVECGKTYRGRGEYHRVIKAKDRHSAELVGRAMVGEEIDSCEWIANLIAVEETDKPYTSYWDNGYTFNRVLENMGCLPNRVVFERDETGRIIGLCFIPI